ncbi:MAG TPA: NAD(P)-dependent oxidoreductase [Pseudonocardiaceae bacterium]|jgi:3-hydroxyisobutyrate dehydrogenase|nr:NAD(P)-dependent oxidoreductase [Pseudonocardiaceae bacterium]
MAAPQTVAVLGTGIMGAPMAANLLDAGFAVRVWNRTRAKAQPLAERGAVLADTAADAVTGADVVLTMLANGDAVRSVMTDGALAAMSPAAIWVQAGTVGVAATEMLAELAAEAGIGFVDAPVLGTKQPAVQGKLVVLAGGPTELTERLAPVFAAIGGRTLHLGGVGSATRLKLVVNSWVLAITNGTAEAVGLAGALGVDPNLFLDAISGAPTDSAYAQGKGKQMIADEFDLSFPLTLAAKDARLVLDAAPEGVDLAGVRATLAHLETADRLGHGDADMAALSRAVVTEQAR